MRERLRLRRREAGGADRRASRRRGRRPMLAAQTQRFFFGAGVTAPALPCVDAEFGDADLLAARPSASRRRGRTRSHPVRRQLHRRAPDSAADAACESRPMRAVAEMHGAQKNGNWTNDSLQATMDAVTDDGMSLKQASRVFGVPSTSIKDHLYGKTRGRQRGIPPTLNSHEEKKIVNYVFKMQQLGHPLTPMQLRLKVAVATQGRSTLWSGSRVPGKG